MCMASSRASNRRRRHLTIRGRRFSIRDNRMTDDVVNQNRALIEAIAFGVVESTPEHWRSAILTVTAEVNSNGSSLAFSIVSPDGHRDYSEPNDDLYDRVKSLYDRWSAAGKTWTGMKVTVTLAEDDDIRY